MLLLFECEQTEQQTLCHEIGSCHPFFTSPHCLVTAVLTAPSLPSDRRLHCSLTVAQSTKAAEDKAALLKDEITRLKKNLEEMDAGNEVGVVQCGGCFWCRYRQRRREAEGAQPEMKCRRKGNILYCSNEYRPVGRSVGLVAVHVQYDRSALIYFLAVRFYFIFCFPPFSSSASFSAVSFT